MSNATPVIYTKKKLIAKLKEIVAMGWIENRRHGNDGGVGNTLEDLLGIEENNLPIPNAAEWELKTQRLKTVSMITLAHMEPSPKALKLVPQLLLPKYGWPSQEAGKKYPASELSFRQTINGRSRSDRGFMIVVNRTLRRIEVSFDSSAIGKNHSHWLATVRRRVTLKELGPQPYWGFDDLEHKVGSKLINAFFVQAEVRRSEGKEEYRYCRVAMLQKFSFEALLREIEKGNVLVDFDARTGHNHGTKFRIRQNCLPFLYEKNTSIIDCCNK